MAEPAKAIEKEGKVLAATKTAWNYTLGPVLKHAVMPALEKLIPQGGAEIMQALYTGQGYTPYGPTEQEVGLPAGEQGQAASDQEMSERGGDTQARQPEPIEVQPTINRKVKKEVER